MTGFKFIGGPLDGELFDHHEINALAEFVSMSAPTGDRRLVLMPPLDACYQILRDEIVKGELQTKRFPYELACGVAGTIEYHHARI